MISLVFVFLAGQSNLLLRFGFSFWFLGLSWISQPIWRIGCRSSY